MSAGFGWLSVRLSCCLSSCIRRLASSIVVDAKLGPLSPSRVRSLTQRLLRRTGLVTGNLIECPKHNGCFDFKTGLPKRLPVRQPLATFPVKLDGQTVRETVAGSWRAVSTPRRVTHHRFWQVLVRVNEGKHLQIDYTD
jgi:hypothetical protein